VPNIERSEAPYLQVVRHIRDDIAAGRLAEGERVPSARQIARDWDIAHATAAKVISTLRGEGLVLTTPGAGTVVASQAGRHHSGRDHGVAVHRTGRIYPPGHYARIHVAELTGASAEVAQAFGVDEGTDVIRRVRTTYTDTDVPVACSTSWFDAALLSSCPDLLKLERIPAGTIGYIERMTGRAAATGYDQLAAGTADTEAASELAVDVGAPVLLSRIRWLDHDGNVLEYGESVSPPGRWAYYEYEIRSSPA